MGYTWQYYDLILLGIAASMVLDAGVGILTAVPVPMAVIAGGVLASTIIGHGLFVNAPVDEPRNLTNEVNALN